MKTSVKQRLFTRLMAELTLWVFEQGWEFTDGDAWRAPRVHGKFGVKKTYSAAKSLHKVRLAKDNNLWVDGKYIRDGSHPVWKIIGEKWESMHPLCRWGGRFNDANHFSMTHWGCK